MPPKYDGAGHKSVMYRLFSMLKGTVLGKSSYPVVVTVVEQTVEKSAARVAGIGLVE